jgi:hypothetical protein
MILPSGKSARPVVYAWLILALLLIGLALPTIYQTGLDYDEAVYGHLAKDFLTGRTCEQHMPGSRSIELGGRPFPVFVQGYLGAVKCWMLLPSFAVFGTSVAVMRFTMLAVAVVGILFLMLATRRALGGAAAVLTGFLVGLDPAFFFPSVCEWGAFVPGFLCRCAGLFFLLEWWQRRRAVWMLLAGAAFGVGFFNKIDFIVPLLAIGVGAVVVRSGDVRKSLRAEWRQWLAGLGVFLLTSLPMLLNLVRWFGEIRAVQSGERAGELATKWNIAATLLDGSYFYRLMEAGGLFDRMFAAPASIWSPFGVILGLAVVLLVGMVIRDERNCARGWPMFLLVSTSVAVAGVVLMPAAVRIHHALLVYPFPQMLLAAVATRLFATQFPNPRRQLFTRAVVMIALAVVLIGHIIALRKTQSFVTATGGRGQWATAWTEFAAKLRTQEDVMLVSLDWGFHEQLGFLTDAPRRFEPTWNLQEGKPVALLPDPRCYYLIHPPEFSLFPYGEQYLAAARAADPNLSFESFTNREGWVVFQVFRFSSPR